MVSINKVVHTAESKIEAEAWINSIGKRKYPGTQFQIVRNRQQWIVKTK
jgi:disulfide oxidoreductase YuzD